MFDRFVEEELDTSPQKFFSIEEMENIGEYDALICGRIRYGI